MDWRAQLIEIAPLALAWGGLAIGVVFGFAVERTNFCAMGALSDIANFGDYRRWRAWLLASAVALLGTQALAEAGVVDLALSMYPGPRINWLGHILGGLLFGIGMVFAGGCASRNLVRLGSGDLRAALVLLVMGLFAFMTIGGLLGPLRAALEGATALVLEDTMSSAFPALVSEASGVDEELTRWCVVTLTAAAVLIYCLRDAAFRQAPALVAGGTVVGLCVVGGWALSGLCYDEFADLPSPPQSLTYVRPTADAVDYLERFTANRVPGFGVATVFGVILGAAVSATLRGRFRLIGFADSSDTLRNLAGASLMGIGGVTALGCTIGQSVTGVSTLAVGSFITALAIVAGGRFGLSLLERWMNA
jgi:uncharacterized membrane protein YedE/YeeE